MGLRDCVRSSGQPNTEQVTAEMQFRFVALNPSRVEGMPCAVFPARASGGLVVGARLVRVSHRVEDGNTALMVPLGFVAVMFQALLRALGVATLADPLGTARQPSAAQWSWASAGPLGPRFTSARGHEVRCKGEQGMTRSKACVRKRTSGACHA